jgi:hypothetical protein
MIVVRVPIAAEGISGAAMGAVRSGAPARGPGGDRAARPEAVSAWGAGIRFAGVPSGIARAQLRPAAADESHSEGAARSTQSPPAGPCFGTINVRVY